MTFARNAHDDIVFDLLSLDLPAPPRGLGTPGVVRLFSFSFCCVCMAKKGATRCAELVDSTYDFNGQVANALLVRPLEGFLGRLAAYDAHFDENYTGTVDLSASVCRRARRWSSRETGSVRSAPDRTTNAFSSL